MSKAPILGLLVLVAALSMAQSIWWKKKGETVFDQNLAIAVGEAYLARHYGQDSVSRWRPLKAERAGGNWDVHGTLPPGWRGGTGHILLSAKDGSVVKIWGEK